MFFRCLLFFGFGVNGLFGLWKCDWEELSVRSEVCIMVCRCLVVFLGFILYLFFIGMCMKL